MKRINGELHLERGSFFCFEVREASNGGKKRGAGCRGSSRPLVNARDGFVTKKLSRSGIRCRLNVRMFIEHWEKPQCLLLTLDLLSEDHPKISGDVIFYTSRFY